MTWLDSEIPSNQRTARRPFPSGGGDRRIL